MVRAFNEFGEATSEANLQVRVKPGLILQTQLPADLASTAEEKIRQIEESKIVKTTGLDQDQAHVEAPMFLGPLQDLVVMEQETAIFTTNVVPTNDPRLVLSYYHKKPDGSDEQLMRDATRIKYTNNFGSVTLEISPCYLHDEGIYKIV